MKQKTVKSAKKRLITTGSGKILRRRLSAQHLAMRKSKRVRRLADKKVLVSPADQRKIRQLVPYQ
jgi:large subunit ribosomal protein L35